MSPIERDGRVLRCDYEGNTFWEYGIKHVMVRYQNGNEACLCGFWPYSDSEFTWQERFAQHLRMAA
jgi:hypothetical protein